MLLALSLLQRLKPYQEETIRPFLAKQDHLDYYRQFQSCPALQLQAFFFSHDWPEIFGEKNRNMLLEYIHSAIDDAFEVHQVSPANLSVKNLTDLELTIQEMTKNPRHI